MGMIPGIRTAGLGATMLWLAAMPAWALHGFGTSETWTGGNGDWNTPSFWSTGAVPTAGADPGIADGAATISVSGAASSTIHVGTGSLTVGAAGTLQASSLVEVYGNGTLTVAGTVTTGIYYNDVTATTVIASGGTLNVTGEFDHDEGSTLVLGNGVNFAPNQYVVTGSSGSATVAVNGGDRATISSNITANGPTVALIGKTGSGTLVMTGSVSVNQIDVHGGVLEFDGTTSGALVARSGGTVRGTGTVSGIVSAQAGGTIAPGTASSLGTLTADGLFLNTGSTVLLRVTASGSDKLVVNNNATLDGTLSILPVGLMAGTTVSSLVSVGGTTTGSFASVSNALGNALGFTYDASSGSITVVQNSFAPFALGGNQRAVAQNLDKVVGDSRAASLLAALDSLPGTSLPAAFAQISPVQQTLTAGTTLAVSRMAAGTLQSRMDNIRAGAIGLSLDQVNLIDSDLPASALLAGTDLSLGQGVNILAPDPKNKWGFFLATNGNFGDVDGQTTQSSYHGVGLTAGADYRLDRAFTVGFAAGYDWSKTDFSNSGSNGEANSVRFGPYATWKDQGGDWLDMNVGGAHHWYDSNREGFGGTAVSSTTGLEFDSGVKYGHDFKLGRDREWTLTPTFGLDYMRLMIDGYTESGSLAPLAVQDQTVDSFRTNLGGTVGYTFTSKGVRWTPYLSLGWAHELLDASSAVNARFASGAGDVFATQGDSLGHDSATFGTGVRGAFSDTLSAVLSYSGEANGTYQNHALEASLRVAF